MESENTPITEMPYRKNTIARERYFVGTDQECASVLVWLITVLKYPADSIECFSVGDNKSALRFDSPFLTEIEFRKTLEAFE
jgi:hypothetical protein